MLKGDFPGDLLDDTSEVSDWAFLRDGDGVLAYGGGVDVLAVNYYTPTLVRRRQVSEADHAPRADGEVPTPSGSLAMTWTSCRPRDPAPRWAGPWMPPV